MATGVVGQQPDDEEWDAEEGGLSMHRETQPEEGDEDPDQQSDQGQSPEESARDRPTAQLNGAHVEGADQLLRVCLASIPARQRAIEIDGTLATQSAEARPAETHRRAAGVVEALHTLVIGRKGSTLRPDGRVAARRASR